MERSADTMCPGKIPYPSMHDAQQAAAHFIRRKGTPKRGVQMRCYFCEHCTSYHCGRANGKNRS